MMKKRIFSLMLAVVMLMSVIPFMANAAAEPTIAGTSLTLDGVLGLNIMVKSNGTYMDGYTVKVTIDGDEVSQVIDTYDNEGELCVYRAKLPAHKLAKTVTVELCNAEGAAVDTKQWTAAAYLTAALGEGHELAAALNLYGSNAAAYVNQEAGTAPVPEVNAADLMSYQGESVISGELKPTAALHLHYACTMRISVPADKWTQGHTLLIDGAAQALTADGDVLYCDIPEIRAQEWGKKYNVKITNGSDTVYECNYGVLSFVYTALSVAERNPGEYNLMKSMFRYFKEVDKYNHPGPITLLQEDFNSGLPANWSLFDNGAATTDTSLWPVANGALTYNGECGANSAVLSDTAIDVDDYEFTAQITVPTAGSIGLIWGASEDAKTMHYFRIFASSGQYKLYAGKITGGLGGSMGTATANALSVNAYVSGGKTVTIKIDVEGQAFTIYGDGTKWVSGTTTDANLHGRVGALLRNGAYAKAKAAFDDFKVNSKGTPQEAPDGALLFEDFSAGTLPATWTGYENAASVNGVWTVSNGAAAYTGTDMTNNKVLLSDASVDAENYVLTAKTYFPKPADGSGALCVGIVFGCKDAAKKLHFVRTNLNATNGVCSAYIGYSNDGKSLGSITSQTVTSKVSAYYGQTVTIKVVVQGKHIQFYIQDTLLCEADTTQSVENLSGKVGFFLRGAVAANNAFDDIKVVLPAAE